MSFLERMRRLTEHVAKASKHVRNEDDTKQYLVLPFFEALGYNPFDPTETWREHNPESLHARQTRADYMIKKEGKPIVAVECKTLGHSLGNDEIAQLAGYYTFDDATIGVLTDGVKYRFFADKVKANVMDDRPFYDFDIGDFQDSEVEILEWMTKPSFAPDFIVDAAKEYHVSVESETSQSLEAVEQEITEPIQPKRSEAAESAPDQLDRIAKDILQDTVNVSLVRTKDSKRELGVHLIHNSLLHGAKRLIRLRKMSGWYNLELIELEPSPLGGWEKAGLTTPIPIYDLAELHNHADAIRERAALFYP